MSEPTASLIEQARDLLKLDEARTQGDEQTRGHNLFQFQCAAPRAFALLRQLAERVQELEELNAINEAGANNALSELEKHATLFRETAERLESSERDAGRLREAMERIQCGMPGCDGGHLYVEHHSPDGEFLGTEEVDPASVLSSISGAIGAALKAPK